jgi:hypothetical protein
MGRPVGSLNIQTREKAETLSALVKKYKLSPLESQFKQREHWQDLLDKQMSISSRHRNAKLVREAREWIFRLNEAMAPYVHPKHASITSQAEVKSISAVIRAPVPAKSTAEWLAAHAPQQKIEQTSVMERLGITTRPEPASPALKQYVDEMNEAAEALADADAVIADLNKRMLGN